MDKRTQSLNEAQYLLKQHLKTRLHQLKEMEEEVDFQLRRADDVQESFDNLNVLASIYDKLAI